MELQAKQRLTADWKKDLKEETNEGWKSFVNSLSSMVHITFIGDPGVYEGEGGEVYFHGKDSNPVDSEDNCVSLATMRKITALMEHLEGQAALCPWEDNQLAVLWAKS